MEKYDYMVVLYDYYGELFTDLQRKYFEDYYFNNYTLAEIATNYDISRNAVHKAIHNVEEKLEFYESKLGLVEKAKQFNLLINELKDDDLKNKLKDLF